MKADPGEGNGYENDFQSLCLSAYIYLLMLFLRSDNIDV